MCFQETTKGVPSTSEVHESGHPSVSRFIGPDVKPNEENLKNAAIATRPVRDTAAHLLPEFGLLQSVAAQDTGGRPRGGTPQRYAMDARPDVRKRTIRACA